jgi:hypothetical protein
LFLNKLFHLIILIKSNHSIHILSFHYQLTTMTDHDTKNLFERLPQTIIPTHYDLTIQPFLDKFKFNGNVNIHIQV